MACTCGGWWTQKSIDEYNRGDLDYAFQRHVEFHSMDKETVHKRMEVRYDR